MDRIYISAPFRRFTNDIENRFYGEFTNSCYRDFLEGVDTHLRKLGYETCLPHRDEGMWGSTYITPEDIAEICFSRIRECDIVVCFPDRSRGVHLEIGYAAALRKRILIYLPDSDKESTLMTGLDRITDFEISRYMSDDHLFDLIDASLKRVARKGC